MLSVVICSHNRADLVGDAIVSVLAHAPAGRCELVLVDNASTDATGAVMARAVAAAPTDVRVTHLHEAELGLSAARNAGVAASSGDAIAFLDDDAVAEPGWIEAIGGAFADPDVAVVCGPIRPIWASSPPDWLDPDVWSYYTVFDHGPGAKELSPDEHWFAGANLAFRRSSLEAVGGFSTSLGRIGGALLSNEEREVVRAVAALGGRVRYVPEAAVDHHVAGDRMRRRWLFRRAVWQGVSDVVAEVPGPAAESLVQNLVARPYLVDGVGLAAVATGAPRRMASRRTVRLGTKTWVQLASTRSRDWFARWLRRGGSRHR